MDGRTGYVDRPHDRRVVYHFFAESSLYPFPNSGEFLTQGENCRSSLGEDSMRHLLVLQKW